MSAPRHLLFRPLPAAASAGTGRAPDAAAAARPAGVPAHAEPLCADGLEGWRWSGGPTASGVVEGVCATEDSDDAGGPWAAATLPAAVVAAPAPFVVTDVDSTLIRQEVIELLAAHAGREAEVAAVTERAMRGELDFAQSLHARVAVLEGLPATVVDDVVARVEPTAGAVEMVAAVRAAGGRVCAVSGGFTQVLAPLAERWGLHAWAANDLEVRDGRLTGRVTGEVVDRAAKARMLRRWAEQAGLGPGRAVAVGDGANDIDLLAAAGAGVALRAKPALREHADVLVDMPSLTPVRWLLGL